MELVGKKYIIEKRVDGKWWKEGSGTIRDDISLNAIVKTAYAMGKTRCYDDIRIVLTEGEDAKNV